MHRRRRAGLLLVAAASTLLVGGDTARAGGGTWAFEDQGLNREAIFIPGDHVRAYTSLTLEGVVSRAKYKSGAYWGGPEHGPYFGYISGPSLPRARPTAPPIPDGALQVGEVRFTETRRSGVLDVTLEFVMPELEPGYYTLHHCNNPCTRQIGDTMSTPFTVVQDRGQALLAGRLQRLERRDMSFRFRMEDRVEDLQKRNAEVESEIQDLQTRLKELEGKPAAATPPQEPSMWSAVGLGVAGATLALLTLLAFGNFSPRPRRNAATESR